MSGSRDRAAVVGVILLLSVPIGAIVPAANTIASASTHADVVRADAPSDGNGGVQTVTLPPGSTRCSSTAGKPSSPNASCVHGKGVDALQPPAMSLPAGTAQCPSLPGKEASQGAACGSARLTDGPATAGAVHLPAGASRCPSTASKESSLSSACGTELMQAGPGGPDAVRLPLGTTACPSTAAKPSDPTSGCTTAKAAAGLVLFDYILLDVTNLTLSAYPNAVAPGAYSTLTADAHGYDVGPTPWYLEIYDASTGGSVAICGTGTTCSASVSQGSPTTHSYIAYIAYYSTTNPPSGIQATSNYASVTWLSVSLAASTQWLPPGAAATLTAYANTDVGPTPWWLEIYDQSTGGSVAICGSGSSCSASVSQSSATTHSYIAYVAGYSTTNPPPSVQATSNSLAVTWLAVSLSASPTLLVPGAATTLTAYANTDVGPSPYYIEIFDATIGGRVASCPSGSSCSTSVTQSSPTIRDYVAYIAGYGTTNPPPSVQVTSNTVRVSWFTVSLSANPTFLAPGGATTLTATASQDVGPTPYYIEIFDHTTGAFLVACATGISCSTSVSQSAPTTQNFIAYVSSYGTNDPPSSQRATSNVVAVTWWSVTLTESASVLSGGQTLTLTATANFNVSGTPYWVEIFDQSNTYVNACGNGSGTTTVCTGQQTHSVCTAEPCSLPKRDTHFYIAYITNQFSQSYPPAGIQATSNVVNATWSWESCSNEGGIWLYETVDSNAAANKGEIRTTDRTLAGCGAYNTIAWSTQGISPDASFASWMEVGWTLSYDVFGSHYEYWFTEWGLNHTAKGRDSAGIISVCPNALPSFTWWKVESTGKDTWTGSVDCEDGAGFHALMTYSKTTFGNGLGWSETGRFGGTGTSMQDTHQNLQIKSTKGVWSAWSGMSCQNATASNWNWVVLTPSSYQTQQGTPPPC